MNQFSFAIQINCAFSMWLKLGSAPTEMDLRWQQASQGLRSECLWVRTAAET